LRPALQGQGIGMLVIQQVLDEAKRSGKPVVLQVLKVNPARRLYERLGFSATGENETHYFMKATVR
jgi:ribosomal protein S18 acetylase RimI-like enzyme